MGVTLNLKKLTSLFPVDALCKVWFKLTQWIWRKGFFNVLNVVSLYCYYIPLEKGAGLRLIKPEFQLQTMCAMFGWNCSSGFRGVDKDEIRLQADGRTNRWTKDDQKNSHEFSAQVSYKPTKQTNQKHKQRANRENKSLLSLTKSREKMAGNWPRWMENTSFEKNILTPLSPLCYNALWNITQFDEKRS